LNFCIVTLEEVLFFQSDERYTLLATKELDALIRTPIKDLLGGVETAKVWQINSSAIVNASASVTRENLSVSGCIRVVLKKRLAPANFRH
jgi:DNA-binding LytR/AlgR family response regulator